VNSPSAPEGGRWPSAGERRGGRSAGDRGRSAGERGGRSPGDRGRTASDRAGFAPRQDDDGWGPSTAVYSASATHSRGNAPNRVGRTVNEPPPSRPDRGAESWRPAGPVSSREKRATRAADRADRSGPQVDRRTARSVEALQRSRESARETAYERGLPWWAALLLLILIAAIGGLIDTLGSNQLRGGFNVGIVIASVVAILAVKRSHMFPVVIAPPIVYSAAAIFQLYVRSSGLHDKKVVLDAAANYLVYGFPAIAAATAAVLIIAGVRLIWRK
jgi:hypothetical protein